MDACAHACVCVHACTRAHTAVGSKHWLENIARFKPAEMAAGTDGIRKDMLRFYTLACMFTTNSTAQKMCNNGGIAACRAEGASSHTLTVCLRSPAELVWDKNAGGCFRQNVAALMGMAASDVQAVVIMGIPSQAIVDAGCEGKATFTIQEHTDKLKLLVPWGNNGALYSGAHIAKMYELEPSMLVDMRKELAELEASADGRTILSEKRVEWGLNVVAGQDRSALERKIEELQAPHLSINHICT